MGFACLARLIHIQSRPMHSTTAPIAVFAFKRSEHLARTLAALAKCALAEESEITIFCDGARSESEKGEVEKTRGVARAAKGFRKVTVLERSENLGLSKSIASGVSELVLKAGKLIVVEDDLIVAPSFLEFMNSALDRYESEERVMQISGYMYPIAIPGSHDAFFLTHSSCWGWATWSRAWKHFGPQPETLARLRADRSLRAKFDVAGGYPYFSMLEKQEAGEIDSWGIIWYLTLFAKNGLVLMPRRTLVANIGQDGTGTHVDKEQYSDELSSFRVRSLPGVTEDSEALAALSAYFRGKTAPWYRRLFRTGG
jgi:hypothetical protein